jgi:hypothetical protein
VVEPMETHFKSPLKKINGAEFNISHLTSIATPFKYMNFSRNGNKRSSIENKNKGIGH